MSFDQNCLLTVSGQTLFSSLNDVVISHHFKLGVPFLFLNINVGLNVSNATTCQFRRYMCNVHQEGLKIALVNDIKNPLQFSYETLKKFCMTHGFKLYLAILQP